MAMVRAVSVTGIGTGSTGAKQGMTTDWVPAQLSLDTEGRRIFDTALPALTSSPQRLELIKTVAEADHVVLSTRIAAPILLALRHPLQQDL
jgi:hypothetical protein